MLKNKVEEAAVKASASILLNSDIEYSIFSKKMSEDEKTQFLNFPIVILLRKENNLVK